jgi:hypothetical protein
MSVELKKVVVGLDEHTHEVMKIIASVNDQDIGELGRQIIVEALFGKSHALKVTAARFARATKLGNSG